MELDILGIYTFKMKVFIHCNLFEFLLDFVLDVFNLSSFYNIKKKFFFEWYQLHLFVSGAVKFPGRKFLGRILPYPDLGLFPYLSLQHLKLVFQMPMDF